MEPIRSERRILALIGIAAAAVTLMVASASAYDRYSATSSGGNCRTCHGDFRASDYVSATDGVPWKVGSTAYSLHGGHRLMLNDECGACHFSSRYPVYLDRSGGSTYSSGCLGCHGRNEGLVVTGAGLRQLHYRAAVTECGDPECHGDADPATYTPVVESVLPPYYFADAEKPDKPTSPCNIDGKESAIAPPKGLDNDGNSLYDLADADCILTPTRRPTWGWVKRKYH